MSWGLHYIFCAGFKAEEKLRQKCLWRLKEHAGHLKAHCLLQRCPGQGVPSSKHCCQMQWQPLCSGIPCSGTPGMGISSQSWCQDDPGHLHSIIWEVFFNLNDSVILCATAQYLGPVYLGDVEWEGGLRLEFREDGTYSLSSSCYQKEKAEKRKEKAEAEHLCQAPALTTLCIRDQRAVLPLPWGKCSRWEDLVKICKVLWLCCSLEEMTL